MVRVLFINEPGAKSPQRKLFMFYLHKNSNINDLKAAIKLDFGWGISQLTVFFNYKEVNNHESLMKLENFDNEEDLLLVHINSKQPENKLEVILKPKMDDIKLEDVKYFNCSRDNDLIMDRDDNTENGEFPNFVDWHLELCEINNSIIYAKDELKRNITKKESLELLVEAENDFYKLMKEFQISAKKAVRTIVETQVTPLNIFNLCGEGGRKYVSGGMLIRH